MRVVRLLVLINHDAVFSVAKSKLVFFQEVTLYLEAKDSND